MLSKKGIGHGISILFLVPAVGGMPRRVYQWLSAAKGDSRITQIVIPLMIFAGLVMLIIAVERMARRISFRRSDGTSVFVPIKFTTAGTIPLEWASWIFGLPMLILGALPTGAKTGQHVLLWLVGDPGTETIWRIAAYGIVVVILYYLFTAFFHDPRKIGAYINGSKDSGLLSSDGFRFFDRSLEGMALVASLYLIMLEYAQDALWKWFGIPLIVDGLALLLVVCVTLDIVNEVRLRWRAGELVNIAEFHEPWKAGLMRDLLQGKNIPSVIRGYHHRALLYFFGPYIEMSLLVPREQVEAAQATLKDSFPQVATART
jgi:preprotein translocase subunit SecY